MTNKFFQFIEAEAHKTVKNKMKTEDILKSFKALIYESFWSLII